MTARVSCPYCNTTVTLTDVPATGRVPCPRCGEAFPVTVPADPHPPASANGRHVAPGPVPAPDVPRSLGSLALIGVVLAVVVLGAGLYGILRPTPKPPSDTAAPPTGKTPAIFPPAAVPGLGYLPAETNVAFAIQPGPLVAFADRSNPTARGKGSTPDRSGADPQKFLTAAGVPDRVFATLAQLGLSLAQIDHLAGGAVIDDKAPLRVVVVLVLRTPHPDEAAFLKALKATKPADPKAAGHYRVEVSGVPADLVKSGDRAYVVFLAGGESADLAAAANPPRGGAPVALRDSLAKLSPASAAWVATGADAWADKKSVRFAAGFVKQPDLPGRIAGVRAVAAGVALEPDPTVGVAVRGRDAAATAGFRDALAKPFPAATADADWATAAGPFDPAAGVAGWLPK